MSGRNCSGGMLNIAEIVKTYSIGTVFHMLTVWSATPIWAAIFLIAPYLLRSRLIALFETMAACLAFIMIQNRRWGEGNTGEDGYGYSSVVSLGLYPSNFGKSIARISLTAFASQITPLAQSQP